MRLITEDNIDQLTSMSFSDNAARLAGVAGASTIRQINALNMESNKKWDDRLEVKPVRERTRRAPRREALSDTPWGEPASQSSRTYKKNAPKPLVLEKEETDVWGFPVAYKPGTPEYVPGSPSEYRVSSPGYEAGPMTPGYEAGPITPSYPGEGPRTPSYPGEGPRTPIFQEAYSNVSPTYNMGSSVNSPTFQAPYSNVSPTYTGSSVKSPIFQEPYSNVSPTYMGSSVNSPIFQEPYSNVSPTYQISSNVAVPSSPSYNLSPTYSGTPYLPQTPPGPPSPNKQFVEIPYTYPTEPLLTTIESEGESEEEKSKTDSKKINVS